MFCFLGFFLFLPRKAKMPRKPVMKKGSQTNIKDPVGVRFICVCFLYSVSVLFA